MLELPRLFLLYPPSSSFCQSIAAQGWALSSQSPSFALLSQALDQSPREGFCFHPHPHQASALAHLKSQSSHERRLSVFSILSR